MHTILFDLDGTLLPMDLDTFTRNYFSALCKRFSDHYEASVLESAVFAATKAAIKNDGTCTNAQRFWDAFRSRLGDDAISLEPLLNDFYQNEFHNVRACCGENALARHVIDTLHQKGYRTVLATNPIFPSVATAARMHWVDLAPSDFSLVTTYENSRFCKPNPQYYQSILDTLGLSASDCMMVGNDLLEDGAASEAGLPVYLVTDCLIENERYNLSAFPHGSFSEFAAFVDALSQI